MDNKLRYKDLMIFGHLSVEILVREKGVLDSMHGIIMKQYNVVDILEKHKNLGK